MKKALDRFIKQGYNTIKRLRGVKAPPTIEIERVGMGDYETLSVDEFTSFCEKICGTPFSIVRNRTLQTILALGERLDEKQKKYELPQYYIAGGAIRDAVVNYFPKDYDVFVPKEDEEAGCLYGEGLTDLPGNIPSSLPEDPFAVSNHYFPDRAGEIVQLIEKTFSGGVDLCDAFDYNVVKAWYNTRDGFVLHRDFISGMEEKTVSPVNQRSSRFAKKVSWMVDSLPCSLKAWSGYRDKPLVVTAAGNQLNNFIVQNQIQELFPPEINRIMNG